MKKNILFVMPSLAVGGGEKSLVNLLSQIDFESYNVDLFLFNKSGLFMSLLPKEVEIYDLPENYRVFSNSYKASILGFLQRGKVKLAYSRFIFAIKNRLNKNPVTAEQFNWKYLREAFDILDKKYDTAIGYLEKTSIYFVVDRVKAKRKIGWIHTNYRDSGMDKAYDNSYFNQLDYLVTVSEECAKSLEDSFGNYKKKIRVIHNLISPKIINHLALKHIPNNPLKDKNYINIITVARISNEKGIDFAVDACRELIEKGCKIKWYVLGDGIEKGNIERSIKNNNLENHFILLGVHDNPYAYIQEADIYVQPSRYEGKSIALDEAMILRKPIVVTNFSTAKDQIQDGVNGMIVEMNSNAIASGIEKLIQDKPLRKTFEENLAKVELGTEEEVQKLYKIL